jgi:hypothetical protein
LWKFKVFNAAFRSLPREIKKFSLEGLKKRANSRSNDFDG